MVRLMVKRTMIRRIAGIKPSVVLHLFNPGTYNTNWTVGTQLTWPAATCDTRVAAPCTRVQ